MSNRSFTTIDDNALSHYAWNSSSRRRSVGMMKPGFQLPKRNRLSQPSNVKQSRETINLRIEREDHRPSNLINSRSSQSPNRSIRISDYQAQNICLSAILLQDAISGYFSSTKSDTKSQSLYFTYNHPFAIISTYALLALIHLHCIIEEPVVDGFRLSLTLSLSLEVTYIICLILRFMHLWSFTESHAFWKNKSNWIILIVFILMIVDIIIFVVWTIVKEGQHLPRWSRILRPMLLINFQEMKQVRCAFRNIRRTLIEILPIMMLFIFTMVLFSLLGLKILGQYRLIYSNGRPYFQNLMYTLWDLFVLVTTANNPDVIIPAYNQNNITFLYFFSYMIINYFLIMNILLAIIYSVYRNNLMSEVRRSVFIRRHLLAKAFELIAIAIGTHRVITRQIWHQLLICSFPVYNKDKRNLLFDLVGNNKGFISLKQFLNTPQFMNMILTEIQSRKLIFEVWCPSCYNSRLSVFLQNCAKHEGFRNACSFFIVINGICIVISYENLEWVFLSLFLFEIALKLYALGIHHYFEDKWNLFDFILILSAFVVQLKITSDPSLSARYLKDLLMIMRLLRLLKIIGNIQQFSIIISTASNLSSSFGVYALVLAIFYYFFAILGMNLFHNKIQSSGETCGCNQLNGTEFARLKYCSINFNDPVKAFILLFQMLLINQWFVIAEAFVAATSKWAYLYFVVVIFTLNFVILNIVVAFVLEAFLLEYRYTKRERQANAGESYNKDVYVYDQRMFDPNNTSSDVSTLSSSGSSQRKPRASYTDTSTFLESEVPLTPDVGKFQLASAQKKSIDILLEQMFEDELDADLPTALKVKRESDKTEKVGRQSMWLEPKKLKSRQNT